MRKIISAEEREKQTKRRIRILSIFMLVIMGVSSIGYAFLSGDQPGGGEGKNTDSKVKDMGGFWLYEENNEQFSFRTSPENAKNVSVNVYFTIENFYNRPLYIVSDNEAIGYEISSNLGRYSSKVQSACYGPCEKNLPEKNCTDNMIVWKDSAENKVYQMESCIFIEGDISSADAFLYKMFKLI